MPVNGTIISDVYAERTVLLSALSHYLYCPRRAGLIHLESVWQENVFTVKGRLAHERADEPTTRIENGVRIERALPLWSERYGLRGTADVVEFHPDGTVAPVEYKSGKRRDALNNEVQLCAQALCLEEMLGVTVASGAIYFPAPRRRTIVPFDDTLRDETRATIAAVREMLHGAGPLPSPVNDKRCPNCSLNDACVPAVVHAAREAYQARSLYTPRPLEPAL
jgi:CRISPR-associated exonuclease Cas4